MTRKNPARRGLVYRAARLFDEGRRNTKLASMLTRIFEGANQIRRLVIAREILKETAI